MEIKNFKTYISFPNICRLFCQLFLTGRCFVFLASFISPALLAKERKN